MKATKTLEHGYRGVVALVMLVTAALSTGCSTKMLSQGWAVRCSPVTASHLTEDSGPVATKTAEGDLIFRYEARVVQFGILGDWSNHQTVLPTRSLTNLVLSSSLRPVIEFPQLKADHADFPVAVPARDILAAKLPLLELSHAAEGRSAFPASECVVWADDWFWYVPPGRAGDLPVAALLSHRTTATPGSAYATRIVLFPAVLAGDVILASAGVRLG